jgi:ectoine hydroxylase-related dioxygenase (phytanoyl-CoA dioxygenase family)
MLDFSSDKKQIAEEGFTILENIYTEKELAEIKAAIESVNASNANFRRSAGLFAIRQFFREIPIEKLVFNEKLNSVAREIFGMNYFVVKSIYFDKPEQSNWFVACHQDLTISVDSKTEIEGFGPWTVKQDQFSVQPPVHILENIFTVRIHLDDTDENNGALKVLPGSHLKGICRVENIPKTFTEKSCNVKAGGIMIMKPLLFHASSRSTNNKKRRILHLEFSELNLPSGINWAEKMELPSDLNLKSKI